MSDFITRFATKLVNGGIRPKRISDIKETQRFKRIASQDDKGSKASISYWLRVDYDFAFGYARDFKTGIEVRFSSHNDDPNLSRADITRIKKLQKIRQAEEELQIADRHAKIANRAKHVWSMCERDKPTPYTISRAVDVLSARTLGATLIVPMFDDIEGDIINWQRVEPDGRKRFPFGGKKQGCWHIIGQIDPTKPIIICEGWATGASIHMALGCAVVVGFDKDNMLPVAKRMREYYSGTDIIIAGDNDENGAGQAAAEKIRKTVSAVTVVLPPKTGTDFNNLPHDEIKQLIASAISPPLDGLSPEKKLDVQTVEGHWENMLSVDGKGRMLPMSIKNAAIYLTHHHDWKDIFKYDVFKREIMLMRQPPWEDREFKAKRLTDIDIVDTAITMEGYGLVLSKDRIAQAIESVADKNSFNSAQEYFKKLEWDGVCRLETMFSDHFGSTQEHPDYLAFVATKWMTAAIKRIMQPGCKFDHVLILESESQGFYKSGAFKTLATFGDEEESYYTDAISISEIKNPHTILKLQGVMIAELAELEGFAKTSDEMAKNWITQTEDVIKLVYDKYVTKYPRQFIFGATTNKKEYLKDSTGNRRYWPVTVEKIIDLEKLAAERDLLWAEAVWNWKQGLYIGPTPAEEALANIEREKRLNHDPLESQVMNFIQSIKTDDGIKASDIMDRMNLHVRDRTVTLEDRIKFVLKTNGFVNKSKWNRDNHRNERVWVRE